MNLPGRVNYERKNSAGSHYVFLTQVYFDNGPATTSRLVKHIHLGIIYTEIKRLLQIIIEKTFKKIIFTLSIFGNTHYNGSRDGVRSCGCHFAKY